MGTMWSNHSILQSMNNVFLPPYFFHFLKYYLLQNPELMAKQLPWGIIEVYGLQDQKLFFFFFCSERSEEK